MRTVYSFSYRDVSEPFHTSLVYDARHLRNPYSNPQLRDLTGQHHRVRQFVLADPRAEELIERIISECARSRASTVAVGCHGGRHRSVVIAEEIARRTGAQAVHLALQLTPDR